MWFVARKCGTPRVTVFLCAGYRRNHGDIFLKRKRRSCRIGKCRKFRNYRRSVRMAILPTRLCQIFLFCKLASNKIRSDSQQSVFRLPIEALIGICRRVLTASLQTYFAPATQCFLDDTQSYKRIPKKKTNPHFSHLVPCILCKVH